MSGITISADSGTQFETGAAEYNSTCRLDDNNFAVAYRDNNDGNKGKVNVGSRSGVTPTISESNAVIFYNNSVDVVGLVAMSSTKIAIAFRDASTQYIYAVICTISGTTITVGTPVLVWGSATNHCAIAVLDNSNIVVSINYSSSVYHYVGSVSGTIPSFGSAQTVANSNYNGHIATVGLDSTHIACTYRQSASTFASASRVGTVNTGAQTISFGTEVQTGGNDMGEVATLPIIAMFDSEHFIVGYRTAGGGSLHLRAYEVNLTTSNITGGGVIDEGVTSTTDYSICAMGAYNFIVSYFNPSGKAYVRSGTLTGANTIAFDAQGAVIFDNSTSAYTGLCRMTDSYFLLGYKRG